MYMIIFQFPRTIHKSFTINLRFTALFLDRFLFFFSHFTLSRAVLFFRVQARILQASAESSSYHPVL